MAKPALQSTKRASHCSSCNFNRHVLFFISGLGGTLLVRCCCDALCCCEEDEVVVLEDDTRWGGVWCDDATAPLLALFLCKPLVVMSMSLSMVFVATTGVAPKQRHSESNMDCMAVEIPSVLLFEDDCCRCWCPSFPLSICIPVLLLLLIVEVVVVVVVGWCVSWSPAGEIKAGAGSAGAAVLGTDDAAGPPSPVGRVKVAMPLGTLQATVCCLLIDICK